VTTGNRRARLLAGLGADRPVTVPRGNCGGRSSGAVTPGSGVGAPLAGELLGADRPERDGDGLGEGDVLGEGDGDVLGDGEGLGEGDVLGEGDGLRDGEVLGEGDGDGDVLGGGEGLGEGDVLGEGEGDLVDWLGGGDGAPAAVAGGRAGPWLAAAPALPSTAMRIPAATAPPPASARAPARALPGTRRR
jgi:hypothetical protein